VNAFIDEYRARCGVEPICRALQVAPSAYRRHAARQRNPVLLPERAQRDALLLPEVQRVYEQNLRNSPASTVLDASCPTTRPRQAVTSVMC
jgi:putative transposase